MGQSQKTPIQGWNWMSFIAGVFEINKHLAGKPGVQISWYSCVHYLNFQYSNFHHSNFWCSEMWLFNVCYSNIGYSYFHYFNFQSSKFWYQNFQYWMLLVFRNVVAKNMFLKLDIHLVLFSNSVQSYFFCKNSVRAYLYEKNCNQ